MKILLAPDSFKGTISSIDAINYLEDAAKRHFSDLEIVRVPIADGGEGTVDAIIEATGGEYRYLDVTGPIGKKVKAKYGIINGRIAVIEMAQASGLPLLKPEERNPMITTTYGTGELIKATLDEGIRDIFIGIGGSATNDGGIGAMQALGVEFLDENGRNVGFGGGVLSNIERISTLNLDPRIKECRITVICDVSNPLTGERGATAVYGPQKGASADMLDQLEKGMVHYAGLVKRQFGLDFDQIPGAGAAGGLGAALVGFLGAVLKPGIETILDLVDFDRLLEGVDLVVTGEGRIDGQTAYGKVPVGIARRCMKIGVKVVAITGCMGEGAQKVYECGIESIMTTINRDMTLEYALDNAEKLFRDAADRMFRFIKVGMEI